MSFPLRPAHPVKSYYIRTGIKFNIFTFIFWHSSFWKHAQDITL